MNLPSVETLVHVLSTLPGVVYSARIASDGSAAWEYLDENAHSFYGLSNDALAEGPQAFSKYVDPADYAAMLEQFNAIAERGGTFTWEGRMRPPGGKLRWLRSTTTVRRDDDGTVRFGGQTIDITAQRERLDHVERERVRQEQMLRAVLDNLPVAVASYRADGTLLYANASLMRLSTPDTSEMPSVDTSGTIEDVPSFLELRTSDGARVLPVEEYPVMRAMRGESVSEDLEFRFGATGKRRKVEATAAPLRDESGAVWAATVVMQDVSERRLLEDELRVRAADLAASEEAKTVLIDRLRFAIDELSNPILEIWDDILAMPVVGVMDSRRTADMVSKLLQEVARSQAQWVIVDLTGVEVVDTKTADHLIKLVRKVELIGAKCMLTGIQPGVAQTLVDIGVDFGRLRTLRNLKHGLREALGSRRLEAASVPRATTQDAAGIDG